VTPEEISARKILGLIMPSSWWFRRTQNITSIGLFYKNMGILTWRLSDCEELVGVTHRRFWAIKYCVGSAEPTKKPTILGDRVWLC